MAKRRYGTHIASLCPEAVRCIGYHNGAFYVSEYLWRSFADVLRDAPHELTWIGSPGWFGTEAHKCMYEWLATRYDLTGFSEGEWMLVEE